MSLLPWSKAPPNELSADAQEYLRQLNEEGFTRIRGGFPSGVLDDVLVGVKRTLSRKAAIFGKRSPQGVAGAGALEVREVRGA